MTTKPENSPNLIFQFTIKRGNTMKPEKDTITLIISYWNGWEVYLTGTGKLGIETLLATFETIEEARAFCKAFEECGNIATVEDIPYSEVI